jgi:hypothetical protein
MNIDPRKFYNSYLASILAIVAKTMRGSLGVE